MHDNAIFTQSSVLVAQGDAATLGKVTETSACQDLCSMTVNCVAYTHVTEGEALDLPPHTCYIFIHVSIVALYISF